MVGLDAEVRGHQGRNPIRPPLQRGDHPGTAFTEPERRVRDQLAFCPRYLELRAARGRDGFAPASLVERDALAGRLRGKREARRLTPWHDPSGSSAASAR